MSEPTVLPPSSPTWIPVDAADQTERNDVWWIEPLLIFLGFSAFGVYATWAAFQADFYQLHDLARFGAEAVRPYLSPFYSPDLPALFPQLMGWWGWSPAILIMPFPAIFRATCYYYRKAYYRSFFTTPSACSVKGQPSPLAFLLGRGKGDAGYRGESAFPLVMQNLHRFTFYIAALFVLILSIDAIWSVVGWQAIGSARAGAFHVGVGSLVMILNAVLLGLYTFSCHSWRHILAGKLDCFSCSGFTQARYDAWKKQTFLNEHHMLLAWISLFWVAFTDLYIRLCAMGVWRDIVLF